MPKTFALIAATCVFCAQAALAAPPKVTICHRPPGNPSNEKTQTVGPASVQAHLNHGDCLGECPCVAPTTTSSSTSTTTTSSTTSSSTTSSTTVTTVTTVSTSTSSSTTSTTLLPG